MKVLCKKDSFKCKTEDNLCVKVPIEDGGYHFDKNNMYELISENEKFSVVLFKNKKVKIFRSMFLYGFYTPEETQNILRVKLIDRMLK